MKSFILTCSFVLLTVFYFAQKAECQILKYDTKITIEENGKKTTEKSLLIQINSKESNWLSHVEIDHNPNKKLALKFARIIDANGKVVRTLKKKELITRSDLSYQAFYQDNLITELDLFWNKYPYQIEYSYKITEDEFLYAAWWSPVVYFSIPTIQSSLILEVPSSYMVNIRQSSNLKFNKRISDGKELLSWSSAKVDGLTNEIYAPPLKDLIPAVSVVPSNFSYGTNGSFNSWASFGNWLDKLNEGTDDLLLSEKAIVSKLIEGATDTVEIIRKIYHYHQDHTTYINVAIDVGGLKSYPASYVCKNKYGDCKALTTYMKSMLKSVGIDSYYTVINAGSNSSKVQQSFPSQQFNHVILVVPLESDTIWLENTSNVLPFNYQGTFTQNRLALAITNNSELIQTPIMKNKDVLTQRTYEFQINEQGQCATSILLDLRGEEFEKFRYLMSNKSKEEQLNTILNYVNLKSFMPKKWRLINFNRDSTSIHIRVDGNCQSQIRKVGNLKVIKPLRIVLPDFEKPNNRKLNVRINFPINKIDYSLWGLKLMAGEEIQLPEAAEIISKYGHYQTSYEITEKGIQIQEIFILFSGEYTLEEYPKFYSFIKNVNNAKKQSAIIIK